MYQHFWVKYKLIKLGIMIKISGSESYFSISIKFIVFEKQMLLWWNKQLTLAFLTQ